LGRQSLAQSATEKNGVRADCRLQLDRTDICDWRPNNATPAAQPTISDRFLKMKRKPITKQPRCKTHQPVAKCCATIGRWELVTAGAALVLTFCWAFSFQIRQLARTWDTEPDYAHGYLVIPIALLFLWVRRAQFPGVQGVPGLGGLSLLLLGVMAMAVGQRYFLSPVASWGLIAWIAGACWLILGRRALVWALPSILFLLFMIPLPYKAEDVLSVPLRQVATKLSCWGLQLLGQPATSDGFTILLDSTRLEIEEACSGLRMLVMITALAAAFWVLACRNWTERALLAISIVPVALFANSLRIIFAALSFRYFPDRAVAINAHELVGWIVAPAAALSMGLVLAYFRRLFIEQEVGLAHTIDNCRNTNPIEFDVPRPCAT
jgi:exosortase